MRTPLIRMTTGVYYTRYVRYQSSLREQLDAYNASSNFRLQHGHSLSKPLASMNEVG